MNNDNCTLSIEIPRTKQYTNRPTGALSALNQNDRAGIPAPASRRFLRLRDVMEITGLSRSSIYSYIQQGRFPHSVAVGSRAVRWSSSSIYDWMDEKMARSLEQVTSVGGYHE